MSFDYSDADDMWEAIFKEAIPGQCSDCKGKVIGGEPLHEMKITSGNRTWTEWRCRECAEFYAADFWPEDYGPCPYQQHRAGRC
jgi:hypothetical protein